MNQNQTDQKQTYGDPLREIPVEKKDWTMGQTDNGFSPFKRLTIRNKEIHSVPKTNRAGILPASFLRRYRMSRPLGDACSNSSVPDCLSYATMRDWNKTNCYELQSMSKVVFSPHGTCSQKPSVSKGIKTRHTLLSIRTPVPVPSNPCRLRNSFNPSILPGRVFHVSHNQAHILQFSDFFILQCFACFI